MAQGLGDVRSSTMERIEKEQGNETTVKADLRQGVPSHDSHATWADASIAGLLSSKQVQRLSWQSFSISKGLWRLKQFPGHVLFYWYL